MRLITNLRHVADRLGRDSLQHLMLAVGCLAAVLLGWAVAGAAPLVASALYAVGMIAGLWHPAIEAAQKIARAEVDVDFLMLAVAVGAWLLGHPVEAGTLLFLFAGSRAMEAYAHEQTRSSIAALSSEIPREAVVIECGQRRVAPVESLVAGALVLVRPGERVPLDGLVVEGRSEVDLSAMTGESDPMVVERGVEVPSGAVNGGGLLTVRVLRPARESAFQKIMQLIENAPQRRAAAQILSERLGKWFTSAILTATVAGFLGWWLVAGLAIEVAAYRAMVLLVAGSPCAIVLSIPSAILAAISSGARRGVLFHGGRGLYALAEARAVAFDKTGTLSTGEPGVLRRTGPGAEDVNLLTAALELARASTHPASRSVERHLRELGLPADTGQLTAISEVPGTGMRADWQGRRLELGRARTKADDGESADLTRVTLSVDGVEQVRFFLSETPRAGAASTIAALAARGLRPLILSGDAPAAVERMARLVGVDDARGGLSPEEKCAAVRAERERHGVIMVGDGVNDAPALAEANVGVAMGIRGSAATLAQADIVLVKDRLEDLVVAWDLSRRTRRIIRQNLAISLGAAGLLVLGAVFGSLPLALGVFGHEGGTVLVVLNSLRLLWTNAPAAPTGTSRPLAAAAPTAV
jgi:Cd2+/Zn2+-exporting ATPase